MSNFDAKRAASDLPAAPPASAETGGRRLDSAITRSPRAELWEAFSALATLPSPELGDREFGSWSPVRLALLRRIGQLLSEWRAEIEQRERNRD